MKQRILKAGAALYEYMKSPLGLAVIGGAAASAPTYYFDRTKLAKDLVHAQIDKQQLEDRLLVLQNENSNLSRQNRDLANINQDYVKKSGELRDELRHLSTELGAVKNDLIDCRHKVNNTWFFCRNNVYNKKNMDTNSDKHSAVISITKK